jgi:hypothetical protein
MSRDEELLLNGRAEDAKRRLCRGIERSKAVVAQYRAKLLTIRSTLEPSPGIKKLTPLPGKGTP